MARILLLEEEPNIAGIVLFKLRREGHEVVAEEELTPERGLAAAEAMSPDLVLADVDGGHEAVAAALARRWTVLALVDGSDPESAARARAAGAAGVVVKPFKPTVLARIVAGMTRAPAATGGREGA